MKSKQPHRATRRRVPITEQDMDFISFSLDEHIRLAQNHLGCTMEPNVRSERRKAYNAVLRLNNVRRGKVDLDEETVEFLEFSMSERCDLATEGYGETWGRDSHGDLIRTMHIIRKLRKLCEDSHAPSVAAY